MSLEPIVHEYLNTEGNQDGFPNDAFILNRIGQTAIYLESNSSIRALYERNYTAPQTYRTEEQLRTAINEASLYFPRSAIFTSINSNGEYVLRIATPLSPSVMENKSMNAIADVAKLLTEQRFEVEHGLPGEWREETLNVPAVHKYKGELYLSKRKGSTQLSQELISSFLEAHGLKDAVDFIERSNSVIIRIREEAIQDTIKESAAIKDLFDNSEEANKVLDILNFLKGRLGVDYKVITEREASKFIVNSKNTNAFCINGTAYFIKGRKLTADIASEEMLHPLVESIAKNNSREFRALLAEAKKTFPKLNLQIQREYKGFSLADREKELVTLALSRAFKVERERTPEGRKVKDLIKRFSNWFINLFSGQQSFNFNNETLTLDSLAQLINSDSQLQYEKIKDGIKFNKSEETINIYAGTNENADLSNFAERPFKVVPTDNVNNIEGTFRTVEGAFQAQKLNYSNIPQEQKDTIRKKLELATGTLARAIGKSIQGLDRTTWDSVSTEEMSKLVLSSFVQNPDAAKRLKDTGNAILTHTLDRSKWKTIFPLILMSVREDIKTLNIDTVESASKSSLEKMQEISKAISFDPITHTYAINGKIVDMSVTLWVHRNSPIEEETGLNLGYLEVSGMLGTTHDNIARDFLDGQVKTSYPNMTKEDIESFVKSLQRFKDTLDHKYGKGKYKIITDESLLRVVGTIHTPEGPKTIAGTMDMMVVEEDGTYHVYDFKTKRANTNPAIGVDTLAMYQEQVSIYQAIIEANHPELKGKFGGNHLVQINLKYDTPKGSRRNEYGTVEYRLLPNGQVGVLNENGDVIPIQSAAVQGLGGYVAGTFQKTIAVEYKTSAEISSYQQQETIPKTMKKETSKQTENTLTKEEQREKYLQEQAQFTKQLDDLIGGNVIGASEARHIAEQLVYWISDHITSLFQDPSLIEKVYGVKIENVEGMSRAELVNAIGPNRVIEVCKDWFNQGDYGRTTRKKARLIVNNFGALMKLASDVFGNIEKFAIVSTETGDATVTTDINADADNFNESNDSDEISETTGNLQEHWQVESRTLDVMNSMSQLVRQALMQCYILKDSGKVDEAGNPIYEKVKSEFDINERVVAREATSQILKWTQGSISLAHMIAKLEAKAKNNLWVNQILSRLKDQSGKEADFQSQFFNVFSKHFQTYSIVVKEDGQYKSIPVNELPALREATNSVITQFNIGEHPMFTPNGIAEKPAKEFQEILKELLVERNKKVKFGELNREEIVKNLAYASALLGYYATPEMADDALNETSFRKMVDALAYIGKTIEANMGNKDYNPFNFKDKTGSINGNLRRFLESLTERLEDTAVSAFYDSGKMYQSYVTPSYMTKLMQYMSLEGQEFEDFLQSQYADYGWFFDQNVTDIHRASAWKNVWLSLLATDKDSKDIFAHKVQLNFNKHNYMRNMNDTEYALSLFAEYFANEVNLKNPDRTAAWFRVPMLSNKPSSEFIRFWSYRGSNYKTSIVEGLKKVFDQEMSRIQTVEKRNYDESDPRHIKNFDTNGRKFNFLDYMNDYLTGKKETAKIKNGEKEIEVEVHKLMRAKLEGKELTALDESNLNRAVKNIIYQAMQNRAFRILSEWKESGIVEGAKQIANVGKEDTEVLDNLENFIWNDALAAINIMQMTITDIAFYKDAEDLQKRLAQIHAPGIRGNASATDYNGNLVSDGQMRTFYLTDFDNFKSNIKENVGVVFDRKIKQAKTEEEEKVLTALRDSILGQFDEINVADAQGYSSPTSYRKKALLFGKWSQRAEDIYQKLLKGEYTYSDLQVAFQPLKPFVYTQIGKETGVESRMGEKIKVPVQNKNSEYLLIMADAILQGEDTGRPNLLRAIFNVMEESAKKDNTRGIDTVQFESAVKSGLMGRININQFASMEGGEAAAKVMMEKSIYDENGQYNSIFVHEIPVEDYCIQQEIPEHFKSHEQAFGSQARFILASDLDTADIYGNPVTYEVEGRQLTAKQFKIEYEATLAESIRESIANLQTELGLDGISNRVDRNIALSKILQREILQSPRYGVDLLQAVMLNEQGEFRIPLGDPIQSKRIEQLLNSVIKNRVNKQTIAGGPVVQVSNFGTSKELNIRFKKKGSPDELLKTRKEFGGTDAEYEQYIKENQGGIAYFEVFAPIYSNSIFEQFADEHGNIDIAAIEATDPELLKMIGYRIPTEAKYSIAPLKIVGFLPREAGEGIMLPNDITLLTGSDFDVDKEYLMRKEIPIKRRRRGEIKKLIRESIPETVKHSTKVKFLEELDSFMDMLASKKSMTEASAMYPQVARYYRKFAYFSEAPTQGKIYRDNKAIDMAYTVLTHETSVEQMLSPGGFEPQKRMGYMVAAYRNPANEYTWEALQGMSIKELKKACYTDKNLSMIDTHIQFYKQNAAAGALIGMFAVHKVAHAVLESNGYTIDVDSVCKHPFTIAGMEFSGRMEFDTKLDRNGELIGKVLGSLVASAADAVKDPVLNLMNINGNTANILNTLIRLGMPFDTAAMFLSQKVIADVLTSYNSANITGYKSFADTVTQAIEELMVDYIIDESSQLKTEDISMGELVRGIKENKPETDYKVLKALQNLQRLNGIMRGPTFATRFNSISNAVGPLIVDNLIMEHGMTQFSEDIYDAEGNQVTMDSIFYKHPILMEFSRTPQIAQELFGNMPTNSTGFRAILGAIATDHESLVDIIYGDRKLLSQLSDFYQSYITMASGVVKENQLSSYISGFPVWFLKQGFKSKYANNALIQAIKIDTDSKTGRATLKINLTGMDTQQKEALSNSWIDLHKANPELSTRLFMYNFFRCGIGFSPKTFMGLVPTYVKERIPGYIDAFRNLPSVSPQLVLDQFIRNNTDNNKLVPVKSPKFGNKGNSTIEIYSQDEIIELKNTPYMKIKRKNADDVVYRQIAANGDFLLYKEITPLGNNKEYLEMSTSPIVTPARIPVVTMGNLESQNTESDSELSEPTLPTEEIPSYTQEEKTNMILKALQQSKEGADVEYGKKKWSDWRNLSLQEKASREKQMKNFFAGQFSKLGIKFNEETINEIYKEFC